MHYRQSSAPEGQRGAALVIAMLVFALCTALIVAMKSEFTLFYQRGSNVFVSEQAYAYLRGAEDLAAIALLLDYDQDKLRDKPRDDLQELWARPATPYTLDDGGWLQGGMEDLQGRFNLNSLEGEKKNDGTEPGYTASQQQFIRLLQALPQLEIAERDAAIITRSIGDWLDNDNALSLDGAEDDYYSAQSPAYRAANRAMSSVSELRAVANMTPEIYSALAPWVSALPKSDATLNIHTASVLLLRTINEDGDLQPLSEQDAVALVQHRCETEFADVADFLAHQVFSDKKMDAMQSRLGVSSNFFLLSAQAEVAERQMRLYSVLERRGREVNTLVRARGSLHVNPNVKKEDTCSQVQ